MRNSRTISKYLKKVKDVYLNIEFLDKINPNTFELTKNGRIQSTVFGAFSSIVINLNVIDTISGKYNKIEYALHPDRLGLICNKILDGNISSFSKQHRRFPEYIGEVQRSIYTSKVVGDKFECAIFNINYNQEKDEFVFSIKSGIGKLIKDETNKNDFTDFSQSNYIGISIPFEEMELIAYQIKEYLGAYRLTMTPSMLQGRQTYEVRCKSIFKNIMGDARKIREVEEKFSKLSKDEQQDCLLGKKVIE